MKTLSTSSRRGVLRPCLIANFFFFVGTKIMRRSTALLLWVAVLSLELPVAVADVARLESVPDQSELQFSFNQAGAWGTGIFEKFDVRLRLSASDAEPEFLEVIVDVDSLSTRDGERDRMLRGGYFFDVRQHQFATFRSTDIVRHGMRYVATGQIEIRHTTAELALPFEFARTDGHAEIRGQVDISRLDFGVGHGEWGATTWIRDQVRVGYDVVLQAVEPGSL